MCGIVGYVGKEPCVPILIHGLKRLEYRGYDSAGIAVHFDNEIVVKKCKGRLDALCDKLEKETIQGSVGIGHTRWATHGEPSDINAHPHLDMNGEIAIVHNGIIENFQALKEKLIKKGCKFISDTDTEVVAHMLNVYFDRDILHTLIRVIPELQGSFALAILSKSEPDTIYCTRKDSPLILGHSKCGQFLASDIPAILDHGQDLILLEDMEIAVLKADGIRIYDSLGNPVTKNELHIDWNIEAAEKGGFKHFMLKEIYETPDALKKTFARYVDIDTMTIKKDFIPVDSSDAKRLSHITVLACGTAYHAGLVGKMLFEKLVRIPVDPEIASEYRYRDPILFDNDFCIIISQSGETLDTIAAMREYKHSGGKVVAICNAIGSTVAREANHVLYTLAGPEIAVASTKAYVSQLIMLYLLAIDLANKRGQLSDEKTRQMLREIYEIPDKIRELIAETTEQIQRLANRSYNKKHVFFLGRGLDYALAQEASLKLKEISYIHSEAYAAGELKHGTIALIEEDTLVVAIATQQQLISKIKSNIIEVKARGAKVLSVTGSEAEAVEIGQVADWVWKTPSIPDLLAPMLSIIPLQLFAYYMALEKGCDIDKPRNLAKSVTVE